MGSSCLIALEFHFEKMKKVLGIVGDDGCITMRMYLMPLNYALNNG